MGYHYLLMSLWMSFYPVLATDEFPIVFKWNICPTATENDLPHSCSSYLKALNSSAELLEQFITVFTKTVNERLQVEEYFDTSVPSDVVAAKSYAASLEVGFEGGLQKPEAGAKLMADTMELLFNKFTPQQFLYVVGHSVGQYLMSEGILTDYNVDSSAESFASTMVNALEGSPDRFFHNLGRGFIDFLLPLSLLSTHKYDTWHSHAIYSLYKLSGMHPMN